MAVLSYDTLLAAHGPIDERRSQRHAPLPRTTRGQPPPRPGFAYLVFRCGTEARVSMGGNYEVVRLCEEHR